MLVENLKVLITADDKASKGFQSAKSSLNQLGESLERMAGAATMASAALTAAGAVALSTAAKYDRGVRDSVDQLQGAYNRLAIEVSRALLPALRTTAVMVSNLVRAFQSLSPGTREAIGTFATFAATALAVLGTGSKLVSVFAKLAPVVLPVLPALAAAAAALAAIVVAVGLVQEAWDANFGGIRDITHDVINDVQRMWKELLAWFKASGPGLSATFKKIGDAILTGMTAPLEYFSGLAADVFKTLGADKLAAGFRAVSGTIKEIRVGGVEQLGKDLWSAGEMLGRGIEKGARRGLKTFKGMLGGLTSGGVVSAPVSIDQQDKLNSQPMLGPAGPADWATQMERAAATVGHLNATWEMLPGLAQQTGISLEALDRAYKAHAKTVYDSKKAEEAKTKQAATDNLANSVTSSNPVLSGAATGGLAGAIVGLLQMSTEFQALLAEVTAVFGVLAQALNPVIAVVRPLVSIVGNVLGALAPVISLFLKLTSPLLMLAQVVMPVFFEAIRAVGVVLLYAADVISDVWNAIVGALQWFINFLGDTFAFIPGIQDAMHSFSDSLEGLKDKTDYQAEIVKLQNMTLEEATTSIAKETKAREKLNASILNGPSGFRVEAGRFNATTTGVANAIEPARGRPVINNVFVKIGARDVAAAVTEEQAMSNQRNDGFR